MRARAAAPRLALAAALAAVPAACLDDPPVTDADVITSLALAPGPGGELVADGATPIPVEVCVADGGARAAGLAATLRASAGRWVATDSSDGRSITVKLTSACETRQLVPATELGPLTVLATVADFSRAATAQLQAARVTRVRAGVTGALSATASSALTVTAALDVNDGAPGLPSRGTDVELTAAVEPPGAVGYLGDTLLQIADGNTVRTTFFASAAVTQVTFVATARPAGREPIASAPIVIAR